MCVQIIGQFVSKIEVFGHFLEIASLDFSSFAYYDRLDWYLTTLGGCCSRKKFLLCYFAYWRASICEKTHFLEIASLDFSSFAYYDRQAWYLTTSGGRCSKEKFLLWYFAYWRRQYVKKFIFLLYYFITLLLYHFITLSLYYFITLSLYHFITLSLYYFIILYYFITFITLF